MVDMEHELIAEGGDERLDQFVAARVPNLSRAHAQRLIASGDVRVDGATSKPSARVEQGERVSVRLPPPVPVAALAPQSMPLTVVYEDSDLIVVDKPAGLTVHPAPGHPDGTLVNALLAHIPDLAGIEGEVRPGIVHRIDKDTSGLLMVAKNDRAQLALSGQIARHEVFKAYLALVEGSPPDHGVIDAPVGRHPAQRKRMAVVSEGRPARTHYRTIARLGPATLVAAVLETGRTHQVRVHFAALGHPLLGDEVYGRASGVIDRQALHAWRLGFAHPGTAERVELAAALPEDMRAALAELLRREGVVQADARITALLHTARRSSDALAAGATRAETAPTRGTS